MKLNKCKDCGIIIRNRAVRCGSCSDIRREELNKIYAKKRNKKLLTKGKKL